MTDKNTIKELEEQARNTKLLMDKLNLAYLGMTTDEILRLALSNQHGENSGQDGQQNEHHKNFFKN